jgi:hypothetical protein
MVATQRLPRETARCYERFIYWANLGDKRSHAAVMKKYGISRVMVEKMSYQHRWADRLKAMHLEQHERAAEADKQAKLEVARERERRKAVIEESSWEMFVAIKEKVEAMLKFPIQVARATDEEGRKITINPAKWTFSDAARMAQVGDVLARMGLGMPINRSEVTGRDGAPLAPLVAPVLEIKYLSDAESKALIEAAKPQVREQL